MATANSNDIAGMWENVPAGPVSRFLWFCAGADAKILARCPNSDRVKYQGLGGIVLATGVLAFASGSYAFYTVFSPKDETALSQATHLPTVGLGLLAGLVWALVIFNIDRFIVSSTGKGDGTDAMTFAKLGKGLPRIIMAVIIGVCISAPLEIRILKPEIEAQLELEQNDYLAKLNAASERNVETRKAELHGKIDVAQKRLDDRVTYFENRRLEIKEQRRKLELEAEGKTASKSAGRGPAWRDKKETLDKMEAELEKDRQADLAKNTVAEGEIEGWKKEIGATDAQLAAAKASNLKQARHLDGLMKRIQISHDIGGSIPWWIVLLLLAIETGPIFFKMMLTRGAYDYMDENVKRMAAARSGVEPSGHVFTHQGNVELREERYHQAEQALKREMDALKVQSEITQTLLDDLKKRAAHDLQQLAPSSGRKPPTS